MKKLKTLYASVLLTLVEEMAAINIFLILSLICLSFYITGLINYLTKYEDNSCSMTYMYEYPQFIKIDVPDGSKFNRYTLYAYSEGRLTEKTRNMFFDGIPVLFIPGNAGSYKQVRSLASVSLRKYLNSNTRFHFDFFTVDLNGEYSGLFGGVLEAQSQYVNLSINAILNLYDKHSNHPENVVLIGHSMGGVIAQNVLMISDNAKSVNSIITLATPNKNPIATLDPLLPEFYGNTFRYWDKHRGQTVNKRVIQRNSKINDDQSINGNNDVALSEDKANKSDISEILFVTIGGGMRDVLVPSGLTYSRFSDINVLTTSIPLVWLSTDHLCIVWCLQLVLVLNRCLFNMVDTKTKQISTNFENRYRAVSNLLTVTNEPAHTKKLNFHPNADWIEDNRRVFSVRHMNGLNTTQYQMIRLVDSHLHQMLAVEVMNLDDDHDWIFGCSANQVRGQSRVCEDGLSLSNHTRHLPSVRYSRRIVYMDLHKIKRKYPIWSHVIFKISPTNEPIQLNFDVYNRDERIIKTSAPSLLSLSSVEILSESPSNVVHYDVTISGFTSVYQALLLDLKPFQCTSKSHHSVATMFVPWMSGDSNVHYFTESKTESMSLRLHQTHQPVTTSSNNVRIRFVLDANCRYSISLRSSFVDSLGQLTRHYSLHILPYMASILILALRQQMLQIRMDGKCSNLLTAMSIGAKPYYVVTIAKMAQKFVSPEAGLPMLLPLLSFAVAWALVFIFGILTYIGIALTGKLAHMFMLRIISLGFSGWAMNGLQRLPIAMGFALIALGAATCGGVTLFASTLFYCILLSKMYEEYMDTIVFTTVRKVAKTILTKTVGESISEENQEENITNPQNTENTNVEETSTCGKKIQTTAEINVEPILNDIDKTGDNSKTKSVNENSKKNTYEENKSEKITKADTLKKKLTDEDIIKEFVEESSEDKIIKTSRDEEIITYDNTNEDTTNKTKTDLNSQINPNEIINEEDLQNTSQQNNDESIMQKFLKSRFVRKFLNKAVDIILPESDVTLTEIHFHLTIFLILVFTTLMNAPALLTWSQNFKYNPSLEPDPSFFTATIIGICVASIWQMEVPKLNLSFSIELGYILYALAAGTLIFSSIALYMVNYFLASALILITVHQYMPNLGFRESVPENITEPSTETITNDQKLSSKYKVMKTKLQED